LSQKLYAKQFAEVTGYPLKAVKQMCKTGIISYLPIGSKFLIDYDIALAEIRTYQESMKKEKQATLEPMELEPKEPFCIERTNDFCGSLKELLRKGA
jgi:hypothetical protein